MGKLKLLCMVSCIMLSFSVYAGASICPGNCTDPLNDCPDCSVKTHAKKCSLILGEVNPDPDPDQK